MTDQTETPTDSLEPSPAQLGETMSADPGEWTPLDDLGTEIYVYGDRPVDIAVRRADVDDEVRQLHAEVQRMREMRTALELIGTTCANYTGGWSCTEAPTRSPHANYTADRWCDQCIARTALTGAAFPAPTD